MGEDEPRAAVVPGEPGWYADAADPRRERWWDGIDWTDFSGETPRVLTHPSMRAEHVRVVHVRESNAAVGWIAMSPTWFALVMFALPWFAGVSPLAGVFLAGAPLAAAILLLVLAWRDRNILRSRGMGAPASPLWMFLTPLAYLLARMLALRPYAAGGGAWLVVLGAQLLAIGGIQFFWAGVAGLA